MKWISSGESKALGSDKNGLDEEIFDKVKSEGSLSSSQHFVSKHHNRPVPDLIELFEGTVDHLSQSSSCENPILNFDSSSFCGKRL